jgi:hypothetical protein
MAAWKSVASNITQELFGKMITLHTLDVPAKFRNASSIAPVRNDF